MTRRDTYPIVFDPITSIKNTCSYNNHNEFSEACVMIQRPVPIFKLGNGQMIQTEKLAPIKEFFDVPNIVTTKKGRKYYQINMNEFVLWTNDYSVALGDSATQSVKIQQKK